MKRFLINLFIFAIIIIVADFTLGCIFNSLIEKAKGGDTGRNNYIADQMEEELLVFGSSRAIHHYDPTILTDSLGLSSYNCGKDGNGIIFTYGQYRMFRDRYVPKVIVCDICLGYDLAVSEDNHKYLNWLKMAYDRPGIDSIFWSVDKTERWKMCSQMNRYNTKFVQIISDCINPFQSDIKGYRPLDGSMNYEPEISEKDEPEFVCDELKLYYWDKLITDCKRQGTKLIFMVSPQYRTRSTIDFAPLEMIAKKNGIPFINHHATPYFSENRDYFKDSFHLNEYGASVYTKYIIKELREYIIVNNNINKDSR